METAPDEALAAIEQATARARKLAALVVVAVVVAIVVLALDFMIKNAIVAQVREADELIKAGRNSAHDGAGQATAPKFRGGDIDDSRGPVGRAGMVSDTGMGEGSPGSDRPAPGAVARRVAGPPLSTDSDGRRTEGGQPGPGGMEIPGDGAA
jgi:hypothetical protein